MAAFAVMRSLAAAMARAWRRAGRVEAARHTLARAVIVWKRLCGSTQHIVLVFLKQNEHTLYRQLPQEL